MNNSEQLWLQSFKAVVIVIIQNGPAVRKVCLLQEGYCEKSQIHWSQAKRIHILLSPPT